MRSANSPGRSCRHYSVTICRLDFRWKQRNRALFTWGPCRVGDRRAARTHVSCLPSSNRTCDFPHPASDHLRPAVFARSSFQMAHFAHLRTATSFIRNDIPIVSWQPPAALMRYAEAITATAPNRPVHFMECPVTVPTGSRCTPIQDGVQLLDHTSTRPFDGNDRATFTHALANIAGRPSHVATYTNPTRRPYGIKAETRTSARSSAGSSLDSPPSEERRTDLGVVPNASLARAPLR